MKKQSLLALTFIFSLFLLSACKEKTDQELLIGDWNVTYAVDSDGASWIGDDGDYITKMCFSFSDYNVTITTTDIDKSTNDATEYPRLGTYLWNDNSLEMTFFSTEDTLTMTSGAFNFSNDDQLDMLLHITEWSGSDTSNYILDIRAERK